MQFFKCHAAPEGTHEGKNLFGTEIIAGKGKTFRVFYSRSYFSIASITIQQV